MTDAPEKRTVKGEQVTYGPFEDVPPFSDGGDLRIHYVSVGIVDRNAVAVCVDVIVDSGGSTQKLLSDLERRLPRYRCAHTIINLIHTNAHTLPYLHYI